MLQSEKFSIDRNFFSKQKILSRIKVNSPRELLTCKLYLFCIFTLFCISYFGALYFPHPEAPWAKKGLMFFLCFLWQFSQLIAFLPNPRCFQTICPMRFNLEVDPWCAAHRAHFAHHASFI